MEPFRATLDLYMTKILLVALLVMGTTIIISVKIIRTCNVGYWSKSHFGAYILINKSNKIEEKETIDLPLPLKLFESLNLKPGEYNYFKELRNSTFTALAAHSPYLIYWYLYANGRI